MINKNVFTETKNRLIKINIAVVGSFLFLFSMFIYLYFRGLTYNSLDVKMNQELENVVLQLQSNSFFNPIIIKDPKDMVYVYQGDRLRYYTENKYFEEVLPQIDSGQKDTFFTYTKNGYIFREFNIVVGDYKIQIIRNIDSEMSSLKQLVFVLIISSSVSMLITYFIAVYLSSKSLVQIETAWNNQAKFVQDASHEIRTPISIVSSKLESMLKNPNSTINDEVETIADAMKQTRRMKKMINDLLSLMKEDSITKLNLESVDLEELIGDIYKDYIDIAEFQEKDFRIESKIENKIVVIDKNKLRQLIVILMDNAFKYTLSGDKISIYLTEKDSDLRVIISDTGIGIKEDDIPFIFDRFFRSDNIRNKDIDGSGIGLSIAKMLSLNLNLKILVRSKFGEGTEMELVIPRVTSKKAITR